MAGMALSVAGLQMQTIFRNPLAGPYVLGISAGASLGVALLVLAFSAGSTGQLFEASGNWSIIIASWMGSGLILLLIFLVSLRVNDVLTILVLGILFGGISGALVNILQYFSPESALKSFVVWTMGSLGNVTSSQLTFFIPVVIIGLGMAFVSSKSLNAMLLGETYAKSIGVNVSASRNTVFISTCVLAGTTTAFCGPIGFIGIAVPHIARMFLKTADHKHLIISSAGIGAIILLLSDIISRSPANNQILPINSITSLIGIPVIVWIIVRNKKITRAF
jgi:iron complex transport system permease protein